ncbi:MAG: hypothetical protein HYW01_11690 [Deltaproteobacteria bacterium]|nr:hypothetical protein [Deltaproteobacteria bacterium]
MGAKAGKRINAKLRFRIVGNSGPVAQLLHPLWIPRDDIPLMGNILKAIDDEVSMLPKVRLVVSGGGFIEICLNEHFTRKSWKSKGTLDKLTNLVSERVKPVAETLKGSMRDYVIGVDVFDKNEIGGGQFAVVLNSGEIKTVAWKSFPVLEEQNWLAGFSTRKGRQSPRIVATSLGTTMVLVCHDAQAYNHRNQALVNCADLPTYRAHAIREMDRVMRGSIPKWVFSLIHQIEKEESLKSFQSSYKQIHEDYKHRPTVVGSFGYGRRIQIPERLVELAQFPRGKAKVSIILEAI